MTQVIDKDNNNMDAETGTILGICVTACAGALGWIKNGLNNNTKAQQALELKVAQGHFTKEETKQLVILMSEPSIQKIDDLSDTVKEMDGKIDTLLMRG